MNFRRSLGACTPQLPELMRFLRGGELGKNSAITVLARVLMLVTLASCTTGPPKIVPQPAKPYHIKLSPKVNYYSDDGISSKKVYADSGSKFSKDFEALLSQHPQALAEAKKAYTYNSMSYGGNIAIFVLSLKLFLETVDKADRVNDGELVDDSFQSSDVIPMLAAGIITIFSALRSRSLVENGVELYNEKQDAANNATNLEHIQPPAKYDVSFGLEIAVSDSVNPRSGDWFGNEQVMANWTLRF